MGRSETSRSEQARQVLKQELVQFVRADKKLQELNKQCSEYRKVKKTSQDRLTEIGKILNLDGRKLNYLDETISFTYNKMKPGLSQALLKESLSVYFNSSNKWRSMSPDNVTEEILRTVDLLKERKMEEKEKSLKIAIDNRK
jgi:hypothetical protein